MKQPGNFATPPNESQIDRFKELARELGCDEDEAAFDSALKKLMRPSRGADSWAKPASPDAEAKPQKK